MAFAIQEILQMDVHPQVFCWRTKQSLVVVRFGVNLSATLSLGILYPTEICAISIYSHIFMILGLNILSFF